MIGDGLNLKEDEARRARVPLRMQRDAALLERFTKPAPPEPDTGPDPDFDTRECEGCGEQKPIEEMQTCFLPGTGETYQCNACRGIFGTPGCAGGREP